MCYYWPLNCRVFWLHSVSLYTNQTIDDGWLGVCWKYELDRPLALILLTYIRPHSNRSVIIIILVVFTDDGLRDVREQFEVRNWVTLRRILVLGVFCPFEELILNNWVMRVDVASID